MPRSRLVAVSSLAAATAAAAVSCSAPPKGGLVLAISTDMQTPKDVNVVSVFVSTDSVPKFNYLGRVLPDGTVTLPATLALVEPTSPDARVRIRVTAFQEQTARVLRDVLTTVPHQRTSLLRLPLNFLDDGSAIGSLPTQFVPARRGGGGAPEGDTLFNPLDAKLLDSRCDFDKLQQTSVNGVCTSALVDSAKLPEYDPVQVYGDAGQQPSGAPASCFDVPTCFAGATPVAGLDTGTCTFPLPAGATDGKTAASQLNVALVTPATGSCLAPSQCFVPLENDPLQGWALSGGTVTLTPGVCTKVKAGAQLYMVQGSCPSKSLSSPVCEPAQSASDGGVALDSGSAGDGAVDASVGADASPAGCDGSYVVTCTPNDTCGPTNSGGNAALTVTGTQATVEVPMVDGQGVTTLVPLTGTVDVATCTATFAQPASGTCNKGGTITIGLATGVAAVPCASMATGTCVQGALSCTVARGTLDAGAFDASLPDAGPVDAGPPGAGATVVGSAGGISLTPADESAAVGPITGSLGAEAVLGVLVSDTPGVCTVARQALAGAEQKVSSTQLRLAVAAGGSNAIGPGVYAIGASSSLLALDLGQSAAFASLTQTDALCGFQPATLTGSVPDSQAISGAITVIQVTASSVSGSFDLGFALGSISGTFDAPLCTGVDLQTAFTTSGGSVGPGPDANGICYETPPAPDAGLDGGVALDAGTDAATDAADDADAGSISLDSGSDGGGVPIDVGAGAACTLVPPGSVSWWRAEGDPVDTLGNSSSAWMGPATYGSGIDGQAFTFAGASYVSGTLGSIDPALGGTIEAWVSLDMIPASTFDLFGFSTSGQTMDGGAVVATGLGGSWRADFQFGGQTIQGPTYGALQWVHLAITWTPAGDGGIEDVALYADGQLVGSLPVSFADAGVATSFLMGGEGAGTADMMGVLDEVTVYGGPLTPAQIQAIYAAGAGGKCQCFTSPDCPAAKPSCSAGFCL